MWLLPNIISWLLSYAFIYTVSMLTMRGIMNPLREARMISNGKQNKADYIDYDVLSGYNSTCAGVAELADAADLKSAGAILVGSSPTLGTI